MNDSNRDVNSCFSYRYGGSPLVKMLTVLFMLTMVAACVSSGGIGDSSGVGRKGNDKAMAHARLAESYLKQKQFAVAKEELEEALRIDSNHSHSNYVMALLMQELQQYDSARKHFSRAVRADSEHSAAAHDFGTFLCQTGEERKSVTYFDLAASNPLFSKPELSYMRAGECLARINDPSAESYLKRALSVNPNLRPALYRLAILKYDTDAYFSARAYIERYMAITKPQPASLLLAYKIESKLNAGDVAKDYRRRLLEEFPGSEQAGLLRRKSQ